MIEFSDEDIEVMRKLMKEPELEEIEGNFPQARGYSTCINCKTSIAFETCSWNKIEHYSGATEQFKSPNWYHSPSHKKQCALDDGRVLYAADPGYIIR